MSPRSRVKIDAANSAELRANAQDVLAFTRAGRPKNTSLAYDPKQKEFKVSRLNVIRYDAGRHAY